MASDLQPEARDMAPEHDFKHETIEPSEKGKDGKGTDSLGKIESVAHGAMESSDPFQPLDGVEPYDGRQLVTVRAIVSGAILGSLVSCSNLYLGLMTGFGADATLFSAIFGFAICKGLEKSKIPFLSGHFGPHENNIIQATALGCIGIGFMFMSGVPAMYQLKLLGPTPKSDYGRMISFTVVAGFWGLGFAVPLRKLFILRQARQLSLIFPLGTASAVTIRALHMSGDGVDRARANVRAISASFGACFIWSVATSYAPGILYTWNVFWWIYKWGGESIMSAVSWGWLSWQWSPSMLGIGMLIDLNASLSYFFGTILAWGIIGPSLVAAGAAKGVSYNPDYPDLITYNAFVPGEYRTTPSPRYWILWPAVFMMLAVSLTTILLETQHFGRLVKYGVLQLNDRFHRRPQDVGADRPDRKMSHGDIVDPVAPAHQVRWWEWTSVTVASLVFALVAMKYLFGIPPAMNLLNLALGFMWSIVVIQVFGAAGTSPITTVAKGSQFITGGILRTEKNTRGYESVARINLAGAVLSSAAAQQAGELCQDFRTGFLLGTPARAQWHAQMIGTTVAVFLSPAIFMLFSDAFPCLLDASATTCQFALPAVTAWRVVTEALFMDTFPISQSSWIFSIILSLLGIASVFAKRWLNKHPTLSHWQIWVPNMSLVGLSMTIPGSAITMTVAIGSVGSFLWKKYAFESHEKYMYATAAGAIAGEGVGYVVRSILEIVKVAGPTYYGTTLGCVGDVAC